MRMSNDKIEQIAENKLLLVTNRIMSPLLLGVMSFLGLQVWGDIRAVGDEVVAVKINQAVQESKINDALRRLDRIENQRNGNFMLPPPPLEKKAKIEEGEHNG